MLLFFSREFCAHESAKITTGEYVEIHGGWYKPFLNINRKCATYPDAVLENKQMRLVFGHSGQIA